jgi:hypothetical protein
VCSDRAGCPAFFVRTECRTSRVWATLCRAKRRTLKVDADDQTNPVTSDQYSVSLADQVAPASARERADRRSVWQFARPRLSTYVPITLTIVACVLAFTSVALADTRPRATNAEVQEAYDFAPLITNRQARAVPLGITPLQLERRMHGESWNGTNRFHGRTWKICITYPVTNTGVKDARLGVIADEWTFCFPANNRLKRKFFWDA